LRRHMSGGDVTARAVQLALARDETDEAEQELLKLCRSPSPGPALETAVNAFLRAEGSKAAGEGLEQARTEPDVCPLVGGEWVRRRLAWGDWRCEKRLPALLERGEVGRDALAAFVTGVGDARKGWKLRRIIRCYREHLRAHSYAWGATGYA